MEKESASTFRLLDIMRYRVPEVYEDDTPSGVLKAVREYNPRYLLDIYFLAEDTSVCALLHPSMYDRVYRGWLRAGSIIKIIASEEDMVIEIEAHVYETDETDNEDKSDKISKARKDIYLTSPHPIYNKSGYYIPLFSDEGYVTWDRKWQRSLKTYSEEPTDAEVKEFPEEDTVFALSTAGKKRKASEDPGRMHKSKESVVKGRVLLKSRIFSIEQQTKTTVPLFFSFILSTETRNIKVFVWQSAVQNFFCLQEGDYVAIKGFKIKRKTGALILANRMNSDTDTRYRKIPEISVNSSSPTGSIELTEKISECEIEKDLEFTCVKGQVEYVSSLMRWKEKGKYGKRLREFVYLRVSGVIVKLHSNSFLSLLEIKAGAYVEIRHLRLCVLGGFSFYISSLYTQYYLNESFAPNPDYHVIYRPVLLSLSIENGIGYIPVCISTLSEYQRAAATGLGPLYIDGAPIQSTSPDSAYLKRELAYYGHLISIEEVSAKIDQLYLDETERFIVPGKIIGVRHLAVGDSIGEELFDVSYKMMEEEVEENKEDKNEEDKDKEDKEDKEIKNRKTRKNKIHEKIEENAIIRIGEEDKYLDIQVFQNHLLEGVSFASTVADFLKIKDFSMHHTTVYEELSKQVGKFFYFVIDAIRINESTVLFVGVSVLRE